ncbi:universal stress protein [Umezawaea sp. Da 62-37]|uniref:universal stress protein n=1 Tax=Umezawaea sp. Da 62-37 TaxID=3075927 RepID=UPI0028F6D815|nr:universal stress protein [Umezawaea sp. Da 62-37]WNV87480.1 universal stress protein [Umezawaea sp. Da 62-37]
MDRNPVAPPVVVGVDGSPSALDAVAWAADECARHHLPLRLVHTYLLPATGYPNMIVNASEVLAAFDAQGRLWLAEAETAAHTVAPRIAVETALFAGAAIPLLIEESANAKTIVLGSRGLGGFTGLLLGSTAAALTAHARCPVVVVRDRVVEQGPVVVGVDGSAASESAIGFAFEAASTRNAPLTAVLSWTDVLVESAFQADRFSMDWSEVGAEQQRLLAERMAGWQEKYPDVVVERVVVRDRPVRALVRAAQHARLLVVGSHGRGGFTGMLLGSTSQALVHHAPCPVAVVRSN